MTFNLLDSLYISLITGPTGTGKTAFMCYYVQKLYDRYQNWGLWFTFKSIEKKLDKLTPNWIRPTTNIFDTSYINPRQDKKRIFVMGDEFDRFLSKYAHSGSSAILFSNIISLHRQKGFDFIASDQTFDFLSQIRKRAHWIIFTGLSDTTYQSLKNNLSRNLMNWLDYYYREVVDIGERNKKSLSKDGTGHIIVTNGSRAYKLPFQLPDWYTLEISEIWNDVTLEDLRSDIEIDDVFDSYDTSSAEHICLLLAYHLAVKLFSGGVTKEKLSATYVQASNVYLGEPRQLPGRGRGYPELVSATHSVGCYWCDNQSEYRQILEKIISLSKMSENKIDEKTKKLEDDLVAIFK